MSKLAKKLKKKQRPNKLMLLKEKQINSLLVQAKKFADSYQPDQAVGAYHEVLHRDPRNTEAYSELLNVLLASKQYMEAEKLVYSSLNQHVAGINHSVDLAQIFCAQQKWNEALEILEPVLGKDTISAGVYYYYGQALKGKDKLQESIQFFERVTTIEPDYFDAYMSLCSIYYSLEKNDDLQSLLKRILTLTNEIPENRRGPFLFLLGLYYDFLDKYDMAFQFIEQANKLKMKGRIYDLKSDAVYYNHIKKEVTSQFIKNNIEQGSAEKSPVFIIGMPRSGTSLVEQILSCHPEVKALGELPYIYHFASMFDYSAPATSTRMLASEYFGSVKDLINDSPFFTDNMPQNFLFAGLIHTAFPNAKIIHCVRNAIDTCFSCYKQNFQGPHYYAYDLKSLGGYYLLYNDLMTHWHEAMPGIVLDVHYEDIVQDLPVQVRRILDYCNLSWNDACMNFHQSDRFVATLSSDQVKKPLYERSLNRWEKYKVHLTPLLETLKPVLDKQ